MSNVIADRVAFFLKDFPPFSFLSSKEIEELAEKVTVEFYRPGQYVFEEGNPGNGFCYVLRQGNIKLLKKDGTGDQLVDQCDPGDVFGVRSLLSGNPYVMSARSEEESLLYAIEQKYFQKYLQDHHQFSLYFASGYASGQVIVRSDRQATGLQVQPLGGFDQATLQYTKEVITCDPETTILAAAQTMSEHRVGSIIIVDTDGHPIGIVTDTDLRNKVVAANIPTDQRIATIMSSPVQTVHQHISIGEVMGKMIRSRVHHLVATSDGTPSSPVAGIISDHDVVLSQKNHPAALIKAIAQTDEVEKWASIRNEAEVLLKDYLEKEIAISLVSGLISTINDTIIEKAIKKASIELFGEAKADFCWMNLGSEGREEQLLRTDQDNAIIYANNTEIGQERFLELGSRVNEMLIACGFVACPAEIMARNPNYCQSLDSWKQYFDQWIRTPEPKAVMNATIFFDFRGGYGNASLIQDLETHLLAQIRSNDLFINHLAANALQNPPPLSFFKGFVVERSGEHKDEFDIKKRAMMPLSDAARVLTLGHGVAHIKSTIGRFHKLAELEPKNASLYNDAAQAYEILMRHRALSGLAHQDSGRFVPVESLNKLQRQLLKNAFLPIKELQELISVRFQAAYFS